MTDWNQFFRMDEYLDYRKAQMVEIAQMIEDIMTRAVNKGDGDKLQYISGVLDTIRRIIRLPDGMTTDPEVRLILEMRTAADLADLSASLMRRAITA